MKRVFLLLYLVSISGFLMAQTRTGNSLTGILKDSVSKSALEYATVTIFNDSDKKPVTGTTTDKEGFFILNEIPAGKFRIVFECIGYKTYTMNDVSITKRDAIIDLKNIFLFSKKTTLGGVTVVAQAKLIDNKIDKLVFNAEKDLTSQSGVATDVLKKIPQVSVDVDGNVQLSGSSGIKFLINGKPSTSLGSNVADVLQSIPASQIKSVEVITNPGAKYDAQGLGGIINIILKTNNTKGYNGNLSLTAGTRQENGSFNFNARKNNFGINAFFSGNKRLPSDEINDNYRTTTDSNIISTLHQLTTRRFQRHGFQTGAGFDWTFKKLNNFSGNISYNNFGFNADGHTNQAFQDDKNSGLADILSLIDFGTKFGFHNTDISLDYKRTFKREDQELEIGFTSTTDHNSYHVYNDQFSLPGDSLYYGTRSNNPAGEKEKEITIDYTQPFKNDIKLGIGAKGGFYNVKINSDVLSYEQALQSYEQDDFLSNN